MSENDQIVIERIFNAPTGLIWQMWTQPIHFQNWYGPQGVKIPVAEMDVRVGGKRLVCMEMQTPKGVMKMWTTGEYVEIVPNKRLVYTESMSDENGNVMSASDMGMPEDFPTTTQVIVELEDLGNRTKMKMTHAGMPASQGAGGGWEQAFTKMETYIQTVDSNK
ncbi:MAG: SRPBCC domain-containing protein [Anaerolineae bacterium]|nr:SRPBCC domain-containing protein [Anaerolineae bacterium]